MADLADLMAEFAQQVIGGKCDVVAESFGGWVALWLAAKHPDLVEQLVLQGPAGLRDEGTGGVPADPEARMRALYSKPEHAPKETRTPEVDRRHATRARRLRRRHRRMTTALHKALPAIKARTLIVMGTKDTVAPVIVGAPHQGGHCERASLLHLRRRACARIRRTGSRRAADQPRSSNAARRSSYQHRTPHETG